MLTFEDITPIEEDVKIGQDDCYIKEATGEVSSRYRSRIAAGAKFVDGKLASVEGVGDVECLLVHWCLFYKKDNRQVPLDVVRSLPARVITPLFNRIKEISLLDERETEADLRRRLEDTQRKLAALKEEDPAKKP